MPECCLSTHPHLCKLWSIFEFFQYLLTVYSCIFFFVILCQAVPPFGFSRWLHLAITTVPRSFPSLQFGDVTHHQFNPVSFPAFCPSLSPCFFFHQFAIYLTGFQARLADLGVTVAHCASRPKQVLTNADTLLAFQTGFSSSELIEELPVTTSLAVCHWTGCFCVCCRGLPF